MQIDKRLIEESEVVLDNPLPHVFFESASRLNDRIHFGVEHAIVAGTLGLSAVHRDIGALHKTLRGHAASVCNGDPDTGANRDIISLDGSRVADNLDDFLREL